MGCGKSKEAGRRVDRTPPVRNAPPPMVMGQHTIPVAPGPLSSAQYKNRLVTSGGCLSVGLPGCGYALRYAYVSQRGYYPSEPNKANQDAFNICSGVGGSPQQHLFGVFDGHGECGTECAQAAAHLVLSYLERCPDLADSPHAALADAMVTANNQIHVSPSIDSRLSGAMGLVAYLQGTQLMVANVGDSRAVLAVQEEQVEEQQAPGMGGRRRRMSQPAKQLLNRMSSETGAPLAASFEQAWSEAISGGRQEGGSLWSRGSSGRLSLELPPGAADQHPEQAYSGSSSSYYSTPPNMGPSIGPVATTTMGSSPYSPAPRPQGMLPGGPGDMYSHFAPKLVAVDMSLDQTPFRPDECQRVRAAGATVRTVQQLQGQKSLAFDPWKSESEDGADPPRLWLPHLNSPGTAFTRSLGDRDAEQIGVCAHPEIVTRQLVPGDAFLVLASDGVFEFLSSQAVVDLVAAEEDPYQAALNLTATAYNQWMTKDVRSDDITCIVIKFDWDSSLLQLGGAGGPYMGGAGPPHSWGTATKPGRVLVDTMTLTYRNLSAPGNLPTTGSPLTAASIWPPLHDQQQLHCGQQQQEEEEDQIQIIAPTQLLVTFPKDQGQQLTADARPRQLHSVQQRHHQQQQPAATQAPERGTTADPRQATPRKSEQAPWQQASVHHQWQQQQQLDPLGAAGDGSGVYVKEAAQGGTAHPQSGGGMTLRAAGYSRANGPSDIWKDTSLHQTETDALRRSVSLKAQCTVLEGTAGAAAEEVCHSTWQQQQLQQQQQQAQQQQPEVWQQLEEAVLRKHQTGQQLQQHDHPLPPKPEARTTTEKLAARQAKQVLLQRLIQQQEQLVARLTAAAEPSAPTTSNTVTAVTPGSTVAPALAPVQHSPSTAPPAFPTTSTGRQVSPVKPTHHEHRQPVTGESMFEAVRAPAEARAKTASKAAAPAAPVPGHVSAAPAMPGRQGAAGPGLPRGFSWGGDADHSQLAAGLPQQQQQRQQHQQHQQQPSRDLAHGQSQRPFASIARVQQHIAQQPERVSTGGAHSMQLHTALPSKQQKWDEQPVRGHLRPQLSSSGTGSTQLLQPGSPHHRQGNIPGQGQSFETQDQEFCTQRWQQQQQQQQQPEQEQLQQQQNLLRRPVRKSSAAHREVLALLQDLGRYSTPEPESSRSSCSSDADEGGCPETGSQTAPWDELQLAAGGQGEQQRLQHQQQRPHPSTAAAAAAAESDHAAGLYTAGQLQQAPELPAHCSNPATAVAAGTHKQAPATAAPQPAVNASVQISSAGRSNSPPRSSSPLHRMASSPLGQLLRNNSWRLASGIDAAPISRQHSSNLLLAAAALSRTNSSGGLKDLVGPSAAAAGSQPMSPGRGLLPGDAERRQAIQEAVLQAVLAALPPEVAAASKGQLVEAVGLHGSPAATSCSSGGGSVAGAAAFTAPGVRGQHAGGVPAAADAAAVYGGNSGAAGSSSSGSASYATAVPRVAPQPVHHLPPNALLHGDQASVQNTRQISHVQLMPATGSGSYTRVQVGISPESPVRGEQLPGQQLYMPSRSEKLSKGQAQWGSSSQLPTAAKKPYAAPGYTSAPVHMASASISMSPPAQGMLTTASTPTWPLQGNFVDSAAAPQHSPVVPFGSAVRGTPRDSLEAAADRHLAASTGVPEEQQYPSNWTQYADAAVSVTKRQVDSTAKPAATSRASASLNNSPQPYMAPSSASSSHSGQAGVASASSANVTTSNNRSTAGQKWSSKVSANRTDAAPNQQELQASQVVGCPDPCPTGTAASGYVPCADAVAGRVATAQAHVGAGAYSWSAGKAQNENAPSAATATGGVLLRSPVVSQGVQAPHQQLGRSQLAPMPQYDPAMHGSYAAYLDRLLAGASKQP